MRFVSVQACRDFLALAQSHSRRWQRSLQYERDQRIRLEEALEQLAKQHNHLERAFRGATVLPAGAPGAGPGKGGGPGARGGGVRPASGPGRGGGTGGLGAGVSNWPVAPAKVGGSGAGGLGAGGTSDQPVAPAKVRGLGRGVLPASRPRTADSGALGPWRRRLTRVGIQPSVCPAVLVPVCVVRV